MEKEFNQYYNDKLCIDIKQKMDENYLQIKDFNFENVISLTSNNEISTESKQMLSSISYKWQILNQENKENEDNSEVDKTDQCIFYYTKCIICQRLKYILQLFQQYFVNKYIEIDDENNTNDEIDFISNIFESVLMDKFNVTPILIIDCFQHLQEKHSQHIHKFRNCNNINNYCIYDMMTSFRTRNQRNKQQ